MIVVKGLGAISQQTPATEQKTGLMVDHRLRRWPNRQQYANIGSTSRVCWDIQIVL